MATSKEVGQFIKENIGEDNFAFLSGYLNFSSHSRLQCADIILDAYKKLDKGEIYKQLDQEQKNNLKGALTIDLLSKVMMSIEDLGSLIKALPDLKTFFKEFLEVEPRQARLACKEILKQDNEYFFDLLTYPNVDSLPIDDDEKKLLRKTYERNVDVLKKTIAKIVEFIEKHAKAFLKSKHGYPIFIGIESNYLAEGIDMIIPVLYKTEPNSQSKIVLSGVKVVEKYFKLISTTTHLIKELIFSKLRMIECAGFKQPLYIAHCKLSHKEKKQLEEINRKCCGGITRPKVNIMMKIEGKRSDLKDLVSFFSGDWYFD